MAGEIERWRGEGAEPAGPLFELVVTDTLRRGPEAFVALAHELIARGREQGAVQLVEQAGARWLTNGLVGLVADPRSTAVDLAVRCQLGRVAAEQRYAGAESADDAYEASFSFAHYNQVDDDGSPACVPVVPRTPGPGATLSNLLSFAREWGLMRPFDDVRVCSVRLAGGLVPATDPRLMPFFAGKHYRGCVELLCAVALTRHAFEVRPVPAGQESWVADLLDAVVDRANPALDPGSPRMRKAERIWTRNQSKAATAEHSRLWLSLLRGLVSDGRRYRTGDMTDPPGQPDDPIVGYAMVTSLSSTQAAARLWASGPFVTGLAQGGIGSPGDESCWQSAHLCRYLAGELPAAPWVQP